MLIPKAVLLLGIGRLFRYRNILDLITGAAHKPANTLWPNRRNDVPDRPNRSRRAQHGEAAARQVGPASLGPKLLVLRIAELPAPRSGSGHSLANTERWSGNPRR